MEDLAAVEDGLLYPPGSPFIDLDCEMTSEFLFPSPPAASPSPTANPGPSTNTPTKRSTAPVLEKPAIINGRFTYNLAVLKPTTTLQELTERAQNCFQRFVTREGEDLFLPRSVFQRIDFHGVRDRKRKEKTVNLPNRYQVRLQVKADGRIVFHHHHKRGISKINNIERSRSTGGRMFSPEPEKEKKY